MKRILEGAIDCYVDRLFAIKLFYCYTLACVEYQRDKI